MSESLKRCRLFEGVPAERVQSLVGRCASMQVASGTVLLSPEVRNDRVYIVDSGTFSVHLRSPEDPPYRKLGPGHLVGEISLLRRCLPTAYVVAGEPGEVLPLSEDDLFDLVRNDDQVCRNLMSMLAETVVHNTRRAIDEQRRIAELEARSLRDPLTGLFNRAWFDDELRRLCEIQSESATRLSLILVDVDHFHYYNARHGHLGGDAALIALARTLSARVRPHDGVARYGGEELAILLPQTVLADAAVVAERLLVAVRQMKVRGAEDENLSPLTISLGIAESTPGRGPAELVRDADAQLYRAKRLGRDRWMHAGIPD